MPPNTIDIDLTAKELMHLIEALEHRASRHDSMARANPRAAAPHDASSAFMHKLRSRLIQAGSGFQKFQKERA